MTCQVCGTLCVADAKFCTDCGAVLIEMSSPPPVPAVKIAPVSRSAAVELPKVNVLLLAAILITQLAILWRMPTAPTTADLRNARDAAHRAELLGQIPAVNVRGGSLSIDGDVQVRGQVEIEGPVQIDGSVEADVQNWPPPIFPRPGR